MAFKYQIGLYLALKACRRYIVKWQTQLEANAPAGTYTCIVAILDAINECLPLIIPPPPTT